MRINSLTLQISIRREGNNCKKKKLLHDDNNKGKKKANNIFAVHLLQQTELTNSKVWKKNLLI